MVIGLDQFVGSRYYDSAFVNGGKFLSQFVAENEFDLTTSGGYDYADIERSWAAHPEKVDWADVVPPDSGIADEQEKCSASVFFVYPTGYMGFDLNAPIHSGLFTHPLGFLNDLIADSTATVHASTYNSVGKVFIPRYRQLSGLAFMLDLDSELRELGVKRALDDIIRAFEQFLKWNTGKPIVLAGHSQGSILLCRLAKKILKLDTDWRERLVAAYLVGADLGDGDCGEALRECHGPTDLGCFVHYNVLLEGGDRKKFILAPLSKNLTCTNPLSFIANGGLVPPSENPGSRPILRPLRIAEAVVEHLVLGTSKVLNLMSPIEKGLYGARCSEGVVWVNRVEGSTGYWTTGIFPGLNLHGGESSLFYMSTRLNAQRRLKMFYETKAKQNI